MREGGGSGQAQQGIRVTKKKGGDWLAAGKTFGNGCSAVGAVCSVVSKVAGTDRRESGGEHIRRGGVGVGASEAQ